jgi:probable phosphoglycerate mutase
VIVLVRHGETDANARGLLLGRADPSLSPTGREQAAAVAEQLLRGDPPSAIVSSPLRRAVETAGCIAEVFDLPVELDDAFIEMDYGEWDERPLTDVPRDVWSAWQDDVDFAPPAGESLRQVQARVGARMAELVGRAGSSCIVVVSHVSPIKAATLWALGLDDRPDLSWRLRLDVASITRVTPGPLGPVLSGFNQRPAPPSRS